VFKKLFGKKASPASDKLVLPSDFDSFQEMAFNHTQALMAAHTSSWRIEEAENWDVNLIGGIITWTFADGKVARAPAQLIATWSNTEGTFLWGWDHPSAPPGTALAAQAVHDHAKRHNIKQLLDEKIVCSLEDGWQLAAMAVLAGDLQGVYRGQANETASAYIGFGNVSLSNS